MIDDDGGGILPVQEQSATGTREEIFLIDRVSRRTKQPCVTTRMCSMANGHEMTPV